MTDREPTFTVAEQRALAEAMCPLPLDRARVQRTLHLAARDLRLRRSRHRLALFSVASLTLLLAAAGFWRWSGLNSAADLSFGAAMQITRQLDEYTYEEINSANGKVWTDLENLLRELQNRGQLDSRVQNALLAYLDSPEPTPIAYQEGLEAVRLKLQRGEALTEPDTATLVDSFGAGIHTIRSLGNADTRFSRITRLMCRYLRQDLEAAIANPQTPLPEVPALSF